MGYSKGPEVVLKMPLLSGISLQQWPNVGRESHTYLSHIVKNYNNLANWTVFTQAEAPSFGYKGHRSGGGHLMAGDDFMGYLTPQSSGSRFVYTAVVHLPSMNHLLRAAYCIDDEQLEGGASVCPKEASHWTPWWDIGDFRKFVSHKTESQHGEEIMDSYRKYINPTHVEDDVIAFFPQGARFAVSREKIHRRPKADYERLLATLSKDVDPYAGYYMEWLWSELSLGHQEPCTVPVKRAPVSHAEAMASLAQRFQNAAERQLLDQSISGGVSGGISGGVSTTTFATTKTVVSTTSSTTTRAGITTTLTTTSATTLAAGGLVKLAGTMEVEIAVQGILSQDALEQMFRKALANALGVPLMHVVKRSVSEFGSGKGLRRLQPARTRQYEIAYEVIVPSSMDPDLVV